MNCFLAGSYGQNFPVKDGKYFVHSAINYEYVWDMDPNSGNLHLWKKHGGASQQFIFKSSGSGVYRIFCAQNGVPWTASIVVKIMEQMYGYIHIMIHQHNIGVLDQKIL